MINRKIGLLVPNNSNRLRGQHTLPNRLFDFLEYSKSSSQLELLPINNFYKLIKHNSIQEINDNYLGFINFKRNYLSLPDKLSPILSKKLNVMYYTNAISSINYKEFQLTLSNGFFYALKYNLNWWWSFFPINSEEFQSTGTLPSPKTIGYYFRREGYNKELIRTELDYLKSINNDKNINIIGIGDKRVFLDTINLIPNLKSKLIFLENKPSSILDLINSLKNSGGRYSALELIDDSIPNTYFEMRWNNIPTEIINSGFEFKRTGIPSGIDEINYLFEHPDHKKIIEILADNFYLILDKNFRKELFWTQTQLKNNFYKNKNIQNINFRELFWEAIDSTLNLIKKWKEI